MTRKLFAFITAVFLLISMSVPAFAEVMPRGSDTFAGDLYLVASNDSSLSGYPGHVFIVYKNTSYYSFTIGNMVVHSGDEVTLGTTGVEFPYFEGVWYNLEAYKYHNADEFDTNVYLHTTVTAMDIAIISEYIDNWVEEYNLLIHNCVHFARGIWYEVTGDEYNVITPADLMTIIISNNAHGYNLTLEEQEYVGYYQYGIFLDVH